MDSPRKPTIAVDAVLDAAEAVVVAVVPGRVGVEHRRERGEVAVGDRLEAGGRTTSERRLSVVSMVSVVMACSSRGWLLSAAVR